MIITISGTAGTGKTTIADGLAEKLGYKHINIGHMRREVASQMGLNIVDFDELGNRPENQREFDLKYEEFQKGLDVHENIILDARMSAYCQPKAFKVFLTVSDEEAARRIFTDKERIADKYSSQEEVFQITMKRTFENVERYKKLYGFNLLDQSQYDLVIDTTNNNPDKVIDMIIDKFQEFQKKHIL